MVGVNDAGRRTLFCSDGAHIFPHLLPKRVIRHMHPPRRHTLTAPRDGVVAEVLVLAGDQVSDGALLLRLEPRDG